MYWSGHVHWLKQRNRQEPSKLDLLPIGREIKSDLVRKDVCWIYYSTEEKDPRRGIIWYAYSLVFHQEVTDGVK